MPRIGKALQVHWFLREIRVPVLAGKPRSEGAGSERLSLREPQTLPLLPGPPAGFLGLVLWILPAALTVHSGSARRQQPRSQVGALCVMLNLILSTALRQKLCFKPVYSPTGTSVYSGKILTEHIKKRELERKTISDATWLRN